MNRIKILKTALNAMQQAKRSIKPTVTGKAAKVKKAKRAKIEKNLNKRMNEFAAKIKSDSGFSYDPRLDEYFTLGEQRGFMMSPILNKNAVQIPYTDDLTGTDILNAIPQDYIPRLQRGASLGSWVENGQVYIDPAERYITKLASLIAGKKSKQLQGADLSKVYPDAFYDVNDKAIADLIKRRALQGIATGSLAGGGKLGYELSSEDE